MEDYGKLIESLLEKVSDYLKTTIELARLKLVDKGTDVLSTAISHIVAFVFIALFLLFLNLGIAIWIGNMLNNVVWGFLIVAAFYGILGLTVRLFFYQRIKRKINDFLIKQLFN